MKDSFRFFYAFLIFTCLMVMVLQARATDMPALGVDLDPQPQDIEQDLVSSDQSSAVSEIFTDFRDETLTVLNDEDLE